MQASTLRRDFFTSLVGAVPIADCKRQIYITKLFCISAYLCMKLPPPPPPPPPLLCSVLADLPLPSHMPTPMELSVRGAAVLSPESCKILDTTEPGLCNKITKALLSVDTSFL